MTAVGRRGSEVAVDFGGNDGGEVIVVVLDDGDAIAIANDEVTAGGVPAEISGGMGVGLTTKKVDLFQYRCLGKATIDDQRLRDFGIKVGFFDEVVTVFFEIVNIGFTGDQFSGFGSWISALNHLADEIIGENLIFFGGIEELFTVRGEIDVDGGGSGDFFHQFREASQAIFVDTGQLLLPLGEDQSQSNRRVCQSFGLVHVSGAEEMRSSNFFVVVEDGEDLGAVGRPN